MLRFLIIFFSLLFSFTFLEGQTDNTFWFAIPKVSASHGNPPGSGLPHYLHFNAVHSTTIKVTRPAISDVPILEVNLAEGESYSMNLQDYYPDINDYVCSYNDMIEDKGFKIEASPGEVTAFYEMNSQYNREIFSLKGKNALGTEFTVSTQNKYNNGYTGDGALSGFIILATQDSTVVSVTTKFATQHHAAGTFTVTLNKGETYNVRASSYLAGQHIQGVKVSVLNNKPIAITIFDDSMRYTDASTGNGGCLDTFGDQYIPENITGKEYLVLRGQLGTPTRNVGGLWRQEFIFITAIDSLTNVYINGSYETTLAAGEVYPYAIDTAITNVKLSKSGYVNHVTGGGYGCEQGGAVLPPIDLCTGSYDVTFSHSGPAWNDYALTIMARNDTNDGSPNKNMVASGFTLYVDNDTIPIPASYFEYTSDSSFIYLKDDSEPGGADGPIYDFFFDNIPTGDPPTVARISNTVGRFHLGVLNGGSSDGGKYGYFSDYAANVVSAGIGGAFEKKKNTYCSTDPIRVVATGGSEYLWTCASDPTYNNNFSDKTAADPYFFPDTSSALIMTYDLNVAIQGECSSVDTTLRLYVVNGPASDFSFSRVQGCSPFTTTITNTTDTSNTNNLLKMLWRFNPPDVIVNQNTLPKSFQRTFINTGDTILKVDISLTSSLGNICPSTLKRYIKVLPQVDAAMEADDSAGCNEFPVSFTNLSTGHLDSTSYAWDFGDGHQSYDFEPTYLFGNYTDKDTTYTTQLVVTSPLGCKDTSEVDIQVYPKLDAVFSMDKYSGCSPLTVNLDPSSSFGADSLFWNIDYFYNDSIFKTDSLGLISFTHRDTSLMSGPDTLHVFLVTKNTFDCYDTTNTQNLVVFPEIKAVMDISDTAVCAEDPVNLSNLSQGINLTFDWDFGDNTYKHESILQSHTKSYLNNTNADKQYTISLKAESNFDCISITDTVLTVHPYINADFGMDYGKNCSPLPVTFDDASTRVHTYEWDFGDGSPVETAKDSIEHIFINSNLFADTTFFIRLVGINNEGCSDTMIRNLKVYPPVIASFTPSDTLGCAPFVLPLTNNSTGYSLTYTWDFGDSSYSSNPAKNIYKTYNNFTTDDITYRVALTAESNQGCISTDSADVNVFAMIDANFTLPVTDSCSPLKPRITNLSTVGSKYRFWYLDNMPISSAWEPDVAAISNTTTIEDTISLKLVVYGAVDSAHRSCADTAVENIIVYPELNAGFSLDKTADCQPFVSTIMNNSNIISGTTFRWYIDNDYYSLNPNPRDLNIPNLTSADVTHTLWLYGRSQYGCRDTAAQGFTVHSLVDADFTVSKPDICSGDSVLIDRRGSKGGITTYTWNFNDETQSNRTDSVFYLSYDNLTGGVSANKFIRLTVENAFGCDSSWNESLLVHPKVTADFDPDFYSVCYPHATVFSNSTLNASTYEWKFGDGTSSNLPIPSPHKFKNNSYTNDIVYNIKLKATSSNFCFDTITKQVTIFARPYANFNFPVSVDCPPFTAVMQDSSVGTGLTFFWDFAGEGSSAEQNPEFTFNNSTSSIQDKPVELLVTSNNNCKDSITKKLRVYPEVTADFTPSVSEGCSPLYVEFDGVTNNAQQMQWEMNDKIFSTIEDPVYNFNNATANSKLFNIRFVANSIYNCYDTAESIITLYSTPIADFIPSPSPTGYNTDLDMTPINFSNETVYQNNWSYEWDFGDGNSSDEYQKQFTHNYGPSFWGDNSNNNNIPVRLIAWNNLRSECRDTIVHNVRITPPIPQLQILGDIAGCEPYEAHFQAITKYVYEDEYQWDFGNGVTSTEQSPVFRYEKPGLYTVKLIVRGDGGTKWDSKDVRVYPKPDVDFTFSDTLAYISSQTKEDDMIQFYNHTKYGDEYEWYFDKNDFFDGDMPDTYEEEPRYAYTDTGTYTVVLISSSEYGCSDTLIHPKSIKVKGEGAIIFPTGFFMDPTKGPADEYNTDQYTPNMYLFYPRNRGVEKYKLEIFNRWGTLVFQTDDVNRGWNGYINGVAAKQDVYVWRCRGEYTDGGKFDISGDVTLILTSVNVQTE